MREASLKLARPSFLLFLSFFLSFCSYIRIYTAVYSLSWLHSLALVMPCDVLLYSNGPENRASDFLLRSWGFVFATFILLSCTGAVLQNNTRASRRNFEIIISHSDCTGGKNNTQQRQRPRAPIHFYIYTFPYSPLHFSARFNKKHIAAAQPPARCLSQRLSPVYIKIRAARLLYY